MMYVKEGTFKQKEFKLMESVLFEQKELMESMLTQAEYTSQDTEAKTAAKRTVALNSCNIVSIFAHQMGMHMHCEKAKWQPTRGTGPFENTNLEQAYLKFQ